MVERTPDGRYVVVDGRRWRASDPSMPDGFRAELVGALMDARRAVKVDEGARARVQRAKVALGERGRPWWEPGPVDDERLEATTRALAEHRFPGTICPSDVARAVGGDAWRSLLPRVRDVARALALDGTVELLQRGERLDPAAAWRGPIRIRSCG